MPTTEGPHTKVKTPDQVSCRRCILDSTVPGVRLDEAGVCGHCHMHDALEKRYALDETNHQSFLRMLEEVKARGKNSQYDCIVGLSGGTDSTYCVYTLKQLGLRPLAVHLDNGWVSESAKTNVARATQRLGVDLKVVAPPWEQLHPLYRACLEASVPEMCAPCEVGIASSLYQAAVEENVGYIVLGTSFRTEGINPLRWHYVDPIYFDSCIRESPAAKAAAKNYNRVRTADMLNYVFLKRIKTIQLPLYLPYQNQDIMKILTAELGWEYGGRHHFDCLYKPFVAHIGIHKFGVDFRKVTLAALIRTGQITKEEAQRVLAEETYFEDPESLEYCREKLELTAQEFQDIMSAPPKDFRDYPTYYSLLSKLRLPIKAASALKLTPETMYQKLFDVA